MEGLAKSVAEAELQSRVTDLQRQLRDARDALTQIRSSGGETTNESAEAASNDLPRSAPPGKRGYLFKWQDRSIGWSGTKWSLRFVVLERGKLSYFRSHTADQNPRYVLPLRGCAVRDEGMKRNKRHAKKYPESQAPPIDEVGAYFHVFSIYHRNDSYTADSDEEPSEVVPLLRFSTPSLAEKTQWMKLLSQACAYCDTDEFLADELAAQKEEERRRQQEIDMAKAMPEGRRGTLPPLYFAPAPPPSMKRVPSGAKVTRPRLYRTTSGNLDAEKVEARSTKGYPPSKPMHRSAEPSYLSAEAPLQNYRGLFNLAMILLVVSNFRILLETIRHHGFVLDKIPHLPPLSTDPWTHFPVFTGFVLMQKFILNTLAIEWLLSRGRLWESLGMLLHHLNVHASLLAAVYIVWYHVEDSIKGGFLLLHATITWMKLLSYVLANQDYRLSGGLDTHQATLALVENLDPDADTMSYPHNVTLSNMYYFWLAPTLTYQIAYPRSPRVRFWKLIHIAVRLFITFILFMFLVAQVISPNLKSLVHDLEATHGVITATILAEYGLKLSLAVTYAWLLVFYFYFHLYLNLSAEILRFGDRVFYKDWWNSSEVSAYWRLWNMPVHYWLVRHVYFPCVRLGMSNFMGTFIVFLVSAILHELIISIPFHMVRPWSFLGIMFQIPLVVVTKSLYRRLHGSSIGNIIFWLSFCVVGQPMAILLYAIDYQFSKQVTASGQETQECLAFWGMRCVAGIGRSNTA